MPTRAVRVALVLVVLTVIAHAPSLSGGFVYEDANWLPKLGAVIPFSGGSAWWTLRFNAWMNGSDPFAYHVTNLVFHLLNGALVYALATRVGLQARFAAFAVGIFLLHPIQSEAVDYITGRSELIAATGVLFMALGILSRDIQLKGVAILFGAVVALTAKPSAVSAMVTIAWVGIWSQRSTARSAWAAVASALGMAGFIAWPLLKTQSVFDPSNGLTWFPLYQSAAIWRLMALWVAPIGFTVAHDVESLSRFAAAFSALSLMTVVSLIVAFRQRIDRLCLLGAGWIGSLLLLRLAVPIPELLNEHQMYVATIGFSLIGGRCAELIYVQSDDIPMGREHLCAARS